MKRCEVVKITDKDGKVTATGWVCGGQPSTKPGVPPCYVCIELYIPRGGWRHVRDGVRQCDHAIGGENSDGTKTTCDRYICLEHSARRGDFDYCPDHREANGFPPLKTAATGDYNMQGARWITTRYVSVCTGDGPGCARSLGPGRRALYLPKERVVFCEPCGLQLTNVPELQQSLL